MQFTLSIKDSINPLTVCLLCWNMACITCRNPQCFPWYSVFGFCVFPKYHLAECVMIRIHSCTCPSIQSFTIIAMQRPITALMCHPEVRQMK